MAKANLELMVPFEMRNGLKILDSYENRGSVLEKNTEFEDTFIFSHFSRGRSSAVAVFDNKAGTLQVSMFLSDLTIPIQLGANLMDLKGVFTYCKKGTNFGMKLVKLA